MIMVRVKWKNRYIAFSTMTGSKAYQPLKKWEFLLLLFLFLPDTRLLFQLGWCPYFLRHFISNLILFPQFGFCTTIFEFFPSLCLVCLSPTYALESVKCPICFTGAFLIALYPTTLPFLWAPLTLSEIQLITTQEILLANCSVFQVNIL